MRKFTALKDYVTWFEIPAYDLLRAKAFYDHVYGIAMRTAQVGDFAMAYFPADEGIGGAVVQGPGCLPNDTGALLYLNAGPDLDIVLARVHEAGGRVVMGRTLIGEGAGWFALIIDTEGNRLALHERPGTGKAAPAEKPAGKAKAAGKTGQKAGSKALGKKPVKRVARKAR
jgi:predicted enzyme related to lactoylglutathione lyase